MALHPLSGVYAASLTPLKADYSLDLDSVPVYLDFLAKRGCHGALLLGTTGEGPSFSPAERLTCSALRSRCVTPTPASACWPAQGLHPSPRPPI